jgi:hypothetical protein
MLIPSFSLCSSDSDSSLDDLVVCKKSYESSINRGDTTKQAKNLLSEAFNGSLSESTQVAQEAGRLSSRRTIVPNFDLDSSQSDNDDSVDNAAFTTQTHPTHCKFLSVGSSLEGHGETEQRDAHPAIISNNIIQEDTWSHVSHGA